MRFFKFVKVAVLFCVSLTFVNCKKDSVTEPPAPVDFATLPFQNQYNGSERYLHTIGGFELQDSTYNRTYKFFAMAPDSNFRYLKFYTGIIDTIEIPLTTFVNGHYYYDQSASDVVCPEYGADSNHYAAHFDIDFIDDSVYFHLFDFKGNYWAYHYYFSGVKQ